MNRIEFANARYQAIGNLVVNGATLRISTDPLGQSFNDIVLDLNRMARNENDTALVDLLGAARLLRWRLMTHPQPLSLNAPILDIAAAVINEIRQLRGSLALEGELLLDSLEGRVVQITESDPAIGILLSRILDGLTSDANSVIVATSTTAAMGIKMWLGSHGLPVFSHSDLSLRREIWETEFVIGPPRFFPSGLVSAPSAPSINFLLPDWFHDRSIPRSPISRYSDGPIEIRTFMFGILEPVDESVAEVTTEEEVLPQPVWDLGKELEREPSQDEVVARLVLLSGGLAIFLDDGERIRCLDPSQPKGERVNFRDVSSVGVGTYLLLSEGQTERGILYQEALRLMGTRKTVVEASQSRWKALLEDRISKVGYAKVEKELWDLGVQTIDRIRAWTEPTLVRPQRVQDFQILLNWLGVPVDTTLELANELRRNRSKANANIRERLEDAVDKSDLTQIDVFGHLRMDLGTDGVRGIIATRLLGISPRTEYVSRAEARIPFSSSRSKWLE